MLNEIPEPRSAFSPPNVHKLSSKPSPKKFGQAGAKCSEDSKSVCLIRRTEVEVLSCKLGCCAQKKGVNIFKGSIGSGKGRQRVHTHLLRGKEWRQGGTERKERSRREEKSYSSSCLLSWHFHHRRRWSLFLENSRMKPRQRSIILSILLCLHVIGTQYRSLQGEIITTYSSHSCKALFTLREWKNGNIHKIQG